MRLLFHQGVFMLSRRHFIALSASTLIAMRVGNVGAEGVSLLSDMSLSGSDGEDIALWPGTPPGGGGPDGAPLLTAKGALSHVAVPSLRVFHPEHPTGKAVLIAAGGGYKRIQMGHEAWPAARWLTRQGYTAYVLTYRLPGEGWHDGSLVALQDAQRALRIVRHREKQVSVLGFSAGGHLMGMAATRSDFQSYPEQDALDSTRAYADRAALIYPVITLEKPYSHTSTHKILVGRLASDQENARWSVQNYVSAQTPPIFLVQAEDDPIADPHNTLIMAQACKRAHVPVEMLRYATGGHGFGMGKPGTQTLAWPQHYKVWLQG